MSPPSAATCAAVDPDRVVPAVGGHPVGEPAGRAAGVGDQHHVHVSASGLGDTVPDGGELAGPGRGGAAPRRDRCVRWACIGRHGHRPDQLAGAPEVPVPAADERAQHVDVEVEGVRVVGGVAARERRLADAGRPVEVDHPRPGGHRLRVPFFLIGTCSTWRPSSAGSPSPPRRASACRSAPARRRRSRRARGPAGGARRVRVTTLEVTGAGASAGPPARARGCRLGAAGSRRWLERLGLRGLLGRGLARPGPRRRRLHRHFRARLLAGLVGRRALGVLGPGHRGDVLGRGRRRPWLAPAAAAVAVVRRGRDRRGSCARRPAAAVVGPAAARPARPG